MKSEKASAQKFDYSTATSVYNKDFFYSTLEDPDDYVDGYNSGITIFELVAEKIRTGEASPRTLADYLRKSKVCPSTSMCDGFYDAISHFIHKVLANKQEL
jgi:hypothetical protein